MSLIGVVDNRGAGQGVRRRRRMVLQIEMYSCGSLCSFFGDRLRRSYGDRLPTSEEASTSWRKKLVLSTLPGRPNSPGVLLAGKGSPPSTSPSR